MKVLLHLLAPNYRPQQITDDLASFWATTYPTVRKELRARYPKHSWPEDPRVTSLLQLTESAAKPWAERTASGANARSGDDRGS